MIKSAVLNYLSKRKSDKNLNKSLSYSKTRKVAILFSEHQDNAALKGLTKSLMSDGKEIYNLMMVDNPAKDAAFQYLHLSEKDVSITGRIITPELQKFLNTPFDLMLSLDETHSTLARFILSRCDAPIRAGYASDEHRNTNQLNLIVKPKEKNHHAELLAYLRKIT